MWMVFLTHAWFPIVSSARSKRLRVKGIDCVAVWRTEADVHALEW
jgi:hypothetical protein